MLGRDDETVDYPMGVRQSARIAFPDGCTARYGSCHSVCILDYDILLCFMPSNFRTEKQAAADNGG